MGGISHYKILSAIALLTFTISLAAFLSTENQSVFLGKWMLDNNNTDVIFYVHIFEKDGEIVGEHCFDNGTVEDCWAGVMTSLYDYRKLNHSSIEFTFKTAYGVGASSASQLEGKVQLTKIAQNKVGNHRKTTSRICSS